MKKETVNRLVGGATITGAALAGYFFVLRPRHMRWGATDEEIARSMPGDEWVQNPTYVTNRAITIQARPEQVWPWLAQMGELPRGGFYSYEWIERVLGMQVKNADRILPDCQCLEAGQALDRSGNMIVKAFEPDHYLILTPPTDVEENGFGTSTWCMALYTEEGERTRLVSRVRARFNLRKLAGVFWLCLLDPGQFVMERKMLLEIKRRAEAWAALPARPHSVGEALPVR